MLEKRFNFYVLSSVILHIVVIAVVWRLSSSPEQVYESGRLTTFDVFKNSEIKKSVAPVKKSENSLKAKTDDLTSENNAADAATSVNTELQTASDLAQESEITTPAVLLTLEKATRTDAARSADYSGDSLVEIIINSSGVVIAAKLKNHLLYGLDERALELAQKMKFTPARIGDRVVATRINVRIKFKSE